MNINDKVNSLTEDHGFYTPINLINKLDTDKGYFIGISLGSRSVGKTTGFAIYLLLDFLYNKHRFIYMRDTKDTLDITAPAYFDNAINILNINGIKIEKFEYQSNTYKINGEICGYGVPLSTTQKFKSVNFSTPDSPLRTIIFDEFIAENNRYTKACADKLVSFYTTAARGIDKAYDNDVKLIMIANNVNKFFNPYFLHMGVDRYIGRDNRTKWIKPKEAYWCVELTNEVEATKQVAKSNAFRFASDLYKEQAFRNQSGADQTFIEKIKEPSRPLYNIKFDNKFYQVNEIIKNNVLYIEPGKNEAAEVYTLTLADHSINTTYVPMYRNSLLLSVLLDRFNRGYLYFRNLDCKYMFLFLCNLLDS